jgi:hypothetical protein
MPTFGVAIDFQESLIFYLIPPIIYLNLLSEKKTTSPVNPRIILLLILSLFTYLVSTLYSKNFGMSYYHFWNYFIVVFLLLIYLYYKNHFHKTFETSLIIISVIYCLIFYGQKLGLLPPDAKNFGDSFLSQAWGHSYLGNFLIISTLLSIKNISTTKIYSFFTPILFINTIFLSYSRSALAAIILGLFLLKYPFKKIVILTTIFLLVVMTIKSAIPGQEYKSLDGKRPEYFYQGIVGFISRPLFGNGPGTFTITNNQYRIPSDIGTNTTHNSIIDNLHNQGIFYTIIFSCLLYIGFKHQFKYNFPYFVIGFSSFFGSLLDSYWSNYGILLISLIFIFYQPQNTTQPAHNKDSNSHTKILSFSTIILLLFFISKTTSDYLFLIGKYDQSLTFDPLNLNSRLELLNDPQHLPTTLRLFPQEDTVYHKLVNTVPLPQANNYYLEYIKKHPYTSRDYQLKLLSSANQYHDQQIFNTFEPFYPLLLKKPPTHFESLQFAKNYYLHALHLWQTDNKSASLKYFEKSYQLANGQSHFFIEYANALYHNNYLSLSQEIINSCLGNPYARIHCQEYTSKYSTTPLPPGEYKDTILSL